jgi:hypothetical protein
MYPADYGALSRRKIPKACRPFTKGEYDRYFPRARKYALEEFEDGASVSAVRRRLRRAGAPWFTWFVVEEEYLFWVGRTPADLKMAKYASWMAGLVFYAAAVTYATTANQVMKYGVPLPLAILFGLIVEWTVRRIWRMKRPPVRRPSDNATESKIRLL